LLKQTRIFEYQITRAMTTKLTLTIDDSVVDSAKKYARKNGKSLSGMVENYLKSITTAEIPAQTLSPKVAKLLGVITLSEDFDYKKQISSALMKKYK
jgi:hypothetical protein